MSKRSALILTLAKNAYKPDWNILENENDINTNLPNNTNTESSGKGDLVLGKDDANLINVRTQTIISNERSNSTDTLSIPSTALQKNDDSGSFSEKENIDPFANSDDSDKDRTYIAPSDSESSVEVENQDLSFDDQSTEDKKRTRKRKRNKIQWKKSAAKVARNSGKEYVSCSRSKKVIKERQMRTPCKDTCKYKCTTKVYEEVRQHIFNTYWALGDLQRQRDFLSSCMIPFKPKYQYHRNEKKRRDNNGFYFHVGEERLRVCKYFFKSTLDITDRPIRTVISKRNDVGIVVADLRGKHRHHSTLDVGIREGIRKHINAIPRIESHYMRARSTREYIEGGKTLRDLHRDYVQECIENNVPFGKYLIYHQIFTREFNISFFTPKKDQCGVCATFMNSTEEEKVKLADEYELHLSEKELSRDEKTKDKEKISENYIVACFDLQAMLPCPKGDTSSFYYKSKLSVLNLTVYEMKDKKEEDQCYCYVWDETQGRRGANEIGSCLLKYIEKRTQEKPDVPMDIVFYSDNCFGQQKNRYIITVYIYALLKFPNINSITHKYLIVGHTQNEGDNAHSVIERQIKRCLKSGPIFLPTEYVAIIKTAKKSGNPYSVIEMGFSDFVDTKTLNKAIGNIDNKKKEDDKLSNMQIIKIEKKDPFTIFYKTYYADSEFSQYPIKKPRRSVNRDLLKLEPLYKEKISISETKKKGLLELLDKNHIPSRYSEFYKNL